MNEKREKNKLERAHQKVKLAKSHRNNLKTQSFFKYSSNIGSLMSKKMIELRNMSEAKKYPKCEMKLQNIFE